MVGTVDVSGPSSSTFRSPTRWNSVGLFAIVGALIYSNTLNVPFVFDDLPNIVENRHLWVDSLSPPVLADAAVGGVSAARPVANLTFALNYYYGQHELAPYHVVNIVIHVINSLLVSVLGLRLFDQLGRTDADQTTNKGGDSVVHHNMALVAGLIFLTHPVQTQSVTYTVQRMTSLATLFCLVTMLAYVRGRHSANRTHRLGWWTAAGVSWILALGSKQIAVVVPLLILIYEILISRRIDRRQGIRLAGGTLVVCLAAWGLAHLYLGDSPWQSILGGYQYRDFTISERLLTQLRVVVFYLGLILFPVPQRLNLLHVMAPSTSIGSPHTTWIALVVLSSIVILAVWRARRHRLVSFCILWFFACLLTESSVLALELVYEHRLTLPLVGASLLASYAIFRGCGRQVGWAWGLSWILVIALGASTYRRNADWRDAVVFWSDVLSKSPSEARAWNNRGKSYLGRNEPALAIADYSTALHWKPQLVEAWSNRGSGYTMTAQFDRALADYSQAIALDPRNAAAYSNRGIVYAEMGKYDTAILDYTQAIKLSPHYASAYHNRGISHLAQGQFESALADFGAAIELHPLFAEAFNMRGVTKQRTGDYDAALEDFSAAIRLEARGEAYLNRGITHGLREDFAAARHDFDRAVERLPNDPEAYYNRGVTHAKLGELAAAIADYRRGIELTEGRHAGCQNNLGWILATTDDAGVRDGDTALQHARAACILTDWKNFRALRTLAAACAESGKFADAVKWQRAALNSCPSEARPEMSALLQRYEAGRPYREPSH